MIVELHDAPSFIIDDEASELALLRKHADDSSSRSYLHNPTWKHCLRGSVSSSFDWLSQKRLQGNAIRKLHSSSPGGNVKQF